MRGCFNFPLFVETNVRGRNVPKCQGARERKTERYRERQERERDIERQREIRETERERQRQTDRESLSQPWH